MRTIQTSIEINAPVNRVWEILMNHEMYSGWNPFVKAISGNTSPGSRLSITVQPEGKKPMTFKPVVITNKKFEEFRWLGHLFVKGLFDGEHYFLLEVIGESKTRLIHGERFTGVMAGILLKMIGTSTEKGFEVMNKALKKQAELSDF